MSDASVVRRFEAFGNLFRIPDRLDNRQRSPRKPLRQRLAINQFEHQSGRGAAWLGCRSRSSIP